MKLVSRIVSLVSFFLVIIGAVNWLLVGLTKFDLVLWLFGPKSLWGRIVYGLVGTAGLNELTTYIVRGIRARTLPAAS